MSYSLETTRSSSPSTAARLEGHLNQLHNVFRILADPAHKLRKSAIERREEVSSAWGMMVSRSEWFPWPTTTSPKGIGRLRRIEAPTDGMLSSLGYHVGETQPTRQQVRLCILDYAFECHLPPLGSPDYYSQWGFPQTTQRLKKLANTLAALTRNAKRHDTPSYAKAIHEWENDLLFLYEKYYIRRFSFEWPTADFQS